MRMEVLAASIAVVITVTPAAAQNWDGPYVGASAGLGTASFFFADTGEATIFDRLTGGTAGAQAGYLANLGGFVLGIETDASFGAVSQTIEGIPDVGQSITFSVDQIASVRGRIGADMGRAMPYLTAGAMIGHGQARGSNGDADDHYHFGFVGGLGGELMLTDAVSIRGEYLHGWLAPQGYTDDGITQQAGIRLNAVRVGLNLHY